MLLSISCTLKEITVKVTLAAMRTSRRKNLLSAATRSGRQDLLWSRHKQRLQEEQHLRKTLKLEEIILVALGHIFQHSGCHQRARQPRLHGLDHLIHFFSFYKKAKSGQAGAKGTKLTNVGAVTVQEKEARPTKYT
jgi:hypothetical protein